LTKHPTHQCWACWAVYFWVRGRNSTSNCASDSSCAWLRCML